jgi:uncharacterized SAM-binding protein YcdF (DUF218 family)
MNELFMSLGLESWKSVIAALVLPPAPFLLMAIIGARLMFKHRLTAWFLVLTSCTCLWLLCTEGAGILLQEWLLKPPPPLTVQQVSELKKSPKTAIMVVGGGRRTFAPEYGVTTLSWRSVERLRYGIWLSRETGLPVGYTGGIGHGGAPGQSEAESAARIADKEFSRPLRWQESESRDTRENAGRSVALLRPQGIEHIVIVTNDYHIRRALRNFEAAAQGQAGSAKPIRITAAPMGQPTDGRLQWVDFLPTARGFDRTWVVFHEWLGNLSGA